MLQDDERLVQAVRNMPVDVEPVDVDVHTAVRAAAVPLAEVLHSWSGYKVQVPPIVVPVPSRMPLDNVHKDTVP